MSTPRFSETGLIGGHCAACARRHFPDADVCPWCGRAAVREVVLAREGRLWAWTAVTVAPPGYEGPVPFGFGVVELPADRLRVVTRLTVADPAALHAGEPVVYSVVDVAGHRAWAYGPRELER
jgi:uncharacterized OB-fold protein